jgi:hypothetical protein
MTDFSLIALIRQVIDETDLASPSDLADKVAEMVPPLQVRAALAEALPHLVRIELGRQRTTTAAGPARRAPNRSSKVTALRGYADAWRLRLRDRLHVGQGKDAWKVLADCNATDFRFAADERRTFASGALAAASELEGFAVALEAHGKDRFADLPDSVQAELLGETEKVA